ncbi:MAG: VIT1/CCC1 transporter family protein [Euryarchaeota archaeon]|nr:VIT1/CCC1 transporter family protein [Euryarchaeota archaeon]
MAISEDVDKTARKKILRAQQMEITEYELYQKLAKMAKEPQNREVLTHIAQDELRYYTQLKEVTGQDIPLNAPELYVYYWIARLFGIVFMMKLRDYAIRRRYAALEGVFPEVTRAATQEMSHIATLRDSMNEERLLYMGALVLGLNDAIVEITGAVAGFTFALQSTTLIALAGIITGIAGALSMASSEYLEKQSESAALSAIKAAAYTGGSYLLTAAILIAPYLLFSTYLTALACTLAFAFVIIAFFSVYSAFLLNQRFWSRFPQMLLLSFGIAFVSFLIGSLLRIVLHVNV